MKTKSIIFVAFMALATLVSCEKTNKDMTYPTIEEADFLPANCDRYYLGDTIAVHFTASDNMALGSYNIEIHNNFDHHTHGTSAVECEEEGHEHEGEEGHEHEGEEGHEHEEVEGAWVYQRDFAFPQDTTQYTVDLAIAIPDSVVAGDYHFMLRITDKAGWQTIKAVGIEIIETYAQ